MHRKKISKSKSKWKCNTSKGWSKQDRKIASWLVLSPFRFSAMDLYGQKRLRVEKSFLVIFFLTKFFLLHVFMASYDLWLRVQLTRSMKKKKKKGKNGALKKTFAWCTDHFGFIMCFFLLFLVFISTIFIRIASRHTVHSTCNAYIRECEWVCLYLFPFCNMYEYVFSLILVIPWVINEMCAVVWTTSVKQLKYRSSIHAYMLTHTEYGRV